MEEGTLTCLQTSVLADNQGGDHGNTPSFGVAAEMKLHRVLMWNLIVNDADMLDFGDCERRTAGVHRLHGSIIFTKIPSPSWLGLVQCHK